MENKNTEKKILVINPGSTSTKIGVYLDEKELFSKNIEHSATDLEHFNKVVDQYHFRKEAIVDYLKSNGVEPESLSGIVARGGALPPIEAGAYKVDQDMFDLLKSDTLPEHASNLAAMIGFEIATELNIPVMIYDGVSTDEFEDVARISGLADLERDSLSHALNSKAVARKVAKDIGSDYSKENFIVAHLGGGITISVHKKGRMVDIVSDDEGPFSPERAGRVPIRKLINMCYSGKYDKTTMQRKIRGRGGLISYLGTGSALEVEKRIIAGDKEAEKIFYAMAYQIAKGIGELATVLKGEVSRIIITGGIAHGKMVTDWIKERVEFIAPVVIVPGENELESLALGGLRVLRGEETLKSLKIKK